MEEVIKMMKHTSFNVGTRENMISNCKDCYWNHFMATTGMIECETLEIANYEKRVSIFCEERLGLIKSDLANDFGFSFVATFNEINKLNGIHPLLDSNEDFNKLLRRQ